MMYVSILRMTNSVGLIKIKHLERGDAILQTATGSKTAKRRTKMMELKKVDRG